MKTSLWAKLIIRKHAVHHGVAHGDEGVDAPLGKAEDDEIKPVASGVRARDQRGGRAPR